MAVSVRHTFTALHRFIGAGWLVGGSLALAGFAATLYWGVPHPAAPWALEYADAALGRGRPDQAVQMYEAVARHNPSLRTKARHRASLVYATQLMQPEQARRQLEALMAVTGEPEAKADLLEAVGEFLLEEGKMAGAAARFESAAKVAPGSLHSGRRLLRSAAVLADAGRHRQADALLRRVIQDHPHLQGEAELGRGHLKLRKGKVEQALTRFEAAIASTYDADVLSVARLGRTTCLERLGDLDSALAELEEVDLADDVLAEREVSLRSRRWSGAE